VKDGATVKKDFTLEEATPFCLIKAAAPIPLADDINSASFSDAPDIAVNTAANVDEGFDSIAEWKGPNTAGGRFRIKYSDEGIHLAADMTFANPNLNFGSESEQWKGNAIEFDFQNDPYDPTRATYEPDHNWQLIVGISNDPKWWLYGSLAQVPMLNGKAANIKDYLLIKPGTAANEQLVRLNIPWGFYLKEDKATAITPPKDNDLGAMDVVVDSSTPDATLDNGNRQFQLSWSQFNTGWQEPAILRPIQFCPQAKP